MIRLEAFNKFMVLMFVQSGLKYNPSKKGMIIVIQSTSMLWNESPIQTCEMART